MQHIAPRAIINGLYNKNWNFIYIAYTNTLSKYNNIIIF